MLSVMAIMALFLLRYSGLGNLESVTLGKEVALINRTSMLRAKLVGLDQGNQQAKDRNWSEAGRGRTQKSPDANQGMFRPNRTRRQMGAH